MVRHDGVAVLVSTRLGSEQRPVLASVDPIPVVGDWVLVTDDAVWATLERSSLLRRRDPMRDVVQPIVANIDTVIIVCGLDRPVKDGRVQRATALAWDAGAAPVVVLTKSDLVDDTDAVAKGVEGANPGVDVVVASSTTGSGVDVVRRLGADRTVVLVGESGAGKSSLANALSDGQVASVGAVRRGDAKGRHTTTARHLHVLPSGGVLIDTPGIRTIGLWTDSETVAATFADVDDLAAQCRFSDCAHQGEPGCAVAAAVARGQLHPDRLEAWHTFTDEVDAADRRAEELAWRTPEARSPTSAAPLRRRRGRA